MTQSTKKTLWVVCGLLSFGLLGLALYQRSSHQGAPIQSENRPLGLRSERIGDELRLSWNPKAPPLNNSPEADLVIEDGSHRTQLALPQDQILKGHVNYSPFTDSVIFRMKAFGRDHKSTDEILQVIQSRNTDPPQGVENEPDLTGTADRRSVTPEREIPRRPVYAAPGTMVVRGTLERGTAVDVRIPVDAHGRPADTTTVQAEHKNGGLLHTVARFGKAPAHLWPFHHRGGSGREH